jgi:hypothetical protein
MSLPPGLTQSSAGSFGIILRNCRQVALPCLSPHHMWVKLHFVTWTGDITEIANVNFPSTTITMEGDYSIKANFAINIYTITAVQA